VQLAAADAVYVSMSRCVAVLCTACALMCAAAVPALGDPGTITSHVLSSASERTNEPAVAISADGRMLAAWVAVRGAVEFQEGPEPFYIRHGRIEARLGTTARGWRGAQVLSLDGYGPVAAVGANGTAPSPGARAPCGPLAPCT
jgi:hypothetical protein